MISVQQCGFTQTKSTAHVMCESCAAFVDPEKASDRVPRGEVWYCMNGKEVCEGG